MPTSLIKFEVQLIEADNGSPVDIAQKNFLQSLGTISTVYRYATWSFDSSGNYTQYTSCYGLINSSQASTALSYLNTLNTALGTTVPCISYTVNQQP